jgi:hypothetical protein
MRPIGLNPKIHANKPPGALLRPWSRRPSDIQSNRAVVKPRSLDNRIPIASQLNSS